MGEELASIHSVLSGTPREYHIAANLPGGRVRSFAPSRPIGPIGMVAGSNGVVNVGETRVWQDFLACLETRRATCGLAPHGAVVSELSGHGSPEPAPLHAAAAGGGGSVQGR